MGKKYEFSYVKNFIEIESQSGCELLSDTYTGIDDKLKIKCACGEPFETTFYTFHKQNKRQCNTCVKKKISKSYTFSYEYVNGVVESSGFKLLSNNYTKCSDKITVQCEEGHIWHVTFSNFQKNKRCPECNGHKRLTIDDIRNYVEIESNSGYKVISETYIPNQKIKLLCPENHIYEVKYQNFRALNRRCPQCKGGVRLQFEYVDSYIASQGYKLKSTEYKNNIEKLEMECDQGHTCYISFGKFQVGRRCSECFASKGEQRVGEWLKNSNIPFHTQYIFEDMLSDLNNPLRCDFVVFDKDGKPIVIEYDGEFHYQPIYGKDRLKYTQILDGKKNKYCITNNIKLIRIPYWDFDNIEEILEKELKDLI